jgi:hypothetical protein
MKKSLIYAAVLALVISSCTKDISSFNDNVKDPVTVPAGTLFANATKELVDYVASPNVNVNTFRLWAQHWTQTTYTDESNFELTERNINGEVWDRMYARVLRDCNEARNIIEADQVILEEERNAQLAMISVVEAYAYSMLVDIFGDVPYTEALGGIDDLSPAYDDAETIYSEIIASLDGAIATLASGPSAGELGASDLIYGGNTSSWAAFARSLKLRMAVRMGDKNAGTAKTWAESVTSSDIIDDSSEDALLVYQTTTPNTNPMWEDLVQSGRFDFIAANTLGDVMNSLNDPRRGNYFQNLDSTGAVNGNPFGSGGAYNEFTGPGTMQEDPTFPGVLMSASEVHFLLADAAERGWSTPLSAEEHYNMGIRLSITGWGGTDTHADDYLAQADVAYGTAAGDWKQKIGVQKWIAMYDRGFEAWSTWRLYDYPAMNVAPEIGTITPTRYNYTVDEYSVNGTNVAAANGGKDNTTDKVFWDVN